MSFTEVPRMRSSEGLAKLGQEVKCVWRWWEVEGGSVLWGRAGGELSMVLGSRRQKREQESGGRRGQVHHSPSLRVPGQANLENCGWAVKCEASGKS